jgi:CBS domain containing-hemolysin-like protein
MLHGVLHLTGLDHNADRGRMRRVETRWRKALGLPAGLIERSQESLQERIGLEADRGALGFSLIKHFLLLMMAILIFASIEHISASIIGPARPLWERVLEATVFSWVSMVLVAHLLPQILYRRTEGRWLQSLLPLLRLLVLVSRPLLGLMAFLQSLADLGAEEEEAPENGRPVEDIAALITAGEEEGIIEEGDRKLIQSAAEFSSKTVREVMTPRPNIVAIDQNASLEELRDLVVREQYSRIPVIDGLIDVVLGFVHVRDLYELDPAQAATKKITDLMRPIPAVPETKPADDLLRTMQQDGTHMVIVVDEYGNTAGLATMEDLVEEIVGEIRDEHEPARDVEEIGDGSYIVSGNLDLDRLEELLEFRPHSETESTTVGGLVTEWLGHVPVAGETVEHDGIRIEVTAADERRVSQVKVSRATRNELARSGSKSNGPKTNGDRA